MTMIQHEPALKIFLQKEHHNLVT